MKIKNTFVGLGALLLLINSSCVEDLGNYTYTDGESVIPVVISEIQDNIVVKKGERLEITPVLKNVSDESKYAYSWYVTPSVTGGVLPEKTVLGDTKNLDVVIRLELGGYFLSCEVRDVERDVYVRHQTLLTVNASDVTTGWYVLKDIDNETDFDYINNDGVIYPDVLLNLASPLNSRLKGTAVAMAYQSTRYYHQRTDADGKVTTLANQSAFHILSSEDIKTFNAKDLVLFKNYRDEFYIAPEVCRPQYIKFANTDLFMLNDGQIYAIYGMMASVGKFGGSAPGSYTMHNDLIGGFYGGMIFDLKNHTFYFVNAYGPAITTFPDKKATEDSPALPLANMDYTLVNLLTADESVTTTGYAVMKSVSKEEYYLGTVAFSNGSACPITAFDAIPSGCKFPLAPVKLAPRTGNFVYFADGNKLSVYKNASGLADRESVLKEFPAGETISYLLNPETNPNYLVVLTNSSSGWKMYFFTITGPGNPEFEPEATVTYQGTGSGRFIIYRRS
jgi:hypothetical protein